MYSHSDTTESSSPLARSNSAFVVLMEAAPLHAPPRQYKHSVVATHGSIKPRKLTPSLVPSLIDRQATANPILEVPLSPHGPPRTPAARMHHARLHMIAEMSMIDRLLHAAMYIHSGPPPAPSMHGRQNLPITNLYFAPVTQKARFV